jgi:hypothetical protein
MSFAYTPGLKVVKSTTVRKDRILPIQGDILVRAGDTVTPTTIVAQTYVPSDIHMRPIAYIVGVEPYELPKVMKFKEGDEVKKGDLLAEQRALFGLIKTKHYSRYSGTIELISPVTGMVAIREPPTPIQLDAYIPGKVIQVFEGVGVAVETTASLIQGIFGIGGERAGELMIIAEPNEVLTPDHIDKECAGKILVGGSLVTYDTLQKASEAGVKGIVAGGMKREDLNKFLGYEIGVAITGEENITLTCIITEGFGEMRMAGHIYDLLKYHDGKNASINGATQIRAGVIRPEIIIPLQGTTEIEEEESLAYGMETGTRIRVIRQPYFGALGSVAELPIELQTVETESRVRVLWVKLDDGRHVMVPRANVEIME